MVCSEATPCGVAQTWLSHKLLWLGNCRLGRMLSLILTVWRLLAIKRLSPTCPQCDHCSLVFRMKPYPNLSQSPLPSRSPSSRPNLLNAIWSSIWHWLPPSLSNPTLCVRTRKIGRFHFEKSKRGGLSRMGYRTHCTVHCRGS